ncbi:uncharacterized protein LOC121689657 [Alosa sapidissima]|uniref:uncharacterized protein LOC121689657 n=1 Tax=Alosa sapidissima TaxID=34773 RepID=UPI001C083590|nr:uncharacterized protein LOC121689657 [Alosa sapidissima]
MADEIWLSLFLSAGLCVGLPTVIWALYSLRRHQKAGGHVSAFIYSLIASDILELLLSPFLNTCFLQGIPSHDRSPCWMLCFSFAGARICGLHFHQLVAFEGVLFLTYPKPSSHFFGVVFPTALSLSVWIFVSGINGFTTGYIINLIFCVVPVILAIITSVLTFRLPRSSVGLLSHKRSGFKVLRTALSTLIVLYIPCLVIYSMDFPGLDSESSWLNGAVAIMSLRVVTEPLLCVLVCRETYKCQTHAETETQTHDPGSG